MQPAVPDPFEKRPPPSGRRARDRRAGDGQVGDGQVGYGQVGDGQVGYDVGGFEQGSPFSRWALARYIVGRVILDKLNTGLAVAIGVLLVLAALAYFGLHSTLLTVLLVLVALVALVLRGLLNFVLKRLMGAAAYGPLEDRVRGITGAAGAGVLAELGRVGLPSHVLTLPLLMVRLIFSRRETMSRIRRFEVERAVPKARRDELYLALREAYGSGGR